MAGVNKWIGIGNLTKDPEVKYTPSGTAVATFSIACNETWKNKDGTKEDKVEFISIVAFGKLAVICGEYLHKGKQVYIEGRIQTRQWDDKSGNKRYTTEIIANQMQMLGAKDGGSHKGNAGGQSSAPSSGGSSPPPPTTDDDIPF